MNLEILRSFLAVSKYKSLSKAADSLHITQPTLSTRIKNLEEKLNVPLLTRDWQGCHLTQYGLLLLPYALDMLSNLKDFMNLVDNYNDINNKYLLHSIEIEETDSTFKIGIDHNLTTKLSESIISLLVNNFPSVKFRFITKSTQILIELMDLNIVDVIVYHSDKKIAQPQTELIGLDHMIVVFNKMDYKPFLDDVTNVKKINKPLLFNIKPTINNYLKHFKKFIQHFHINDLQMMTDYNLMKQLIMANRGYTIIPQSIYDVYFDSVHFHAFQLLDYLPSFPIHMTYNRESKFKHISQHLYQMIVKEELFQLNERIH